MNSHVAPKHKYEKKELKKEYFQCPCTAFHEDGKRGIEKSSGSQEKKDDHKEVKKGKVKDIFHVSQMKIATYRYMILYHQARWPLPDSHLFFVCAQAILHSVSNEHERMTPGRNVKQKSYVSADTPAGFVL